MGMAHYVYPGAVHSRFQHALGATHLMQKAIRILQEKEVIISDHEAESLCLAILLHDIGHGPISHSLEGCIIPVSHEEITIWFLEALNLELNGQLSTTIKIFKGTYPRKFMHQLVSGQLDMDRLDYLIRDSFFSGVAEGIVGYDRIISMLNVVDDQLVVEEKASFSIQKFLIARELMYKQVYLHKAGIAVEEMLKSFFRRLKELLLNDAYFTNSFQLILSDDFKNLLLNPSKNRKSLLKCFATLDDSDIYVLLKSCMYVDDFILAELASRLVNRKLFKIKFDINPIDSDFKNEVRQKVNDVIKNYDIVVESLIIEGIERIKTYSAEEDEIIFLLKNGHLEKLSNYFPNFKNQKEVVYYYLCYAV